MNQLSDQSKIWIYQSSRAFQPEEAKALNGILERFAEQWTSHNQALKAIGELVYDRFIVLMVDETMAGASGCSIDKSVHFMKQIESQFQVNLFDRLTFAYLAGEEVKTAGRDDFSQLYQNGTINDETLVFDTLVKTKKQYDDALIKPLKDSWHKRMV